MHVTEPYEPPVDHATSVLLHFLRRRSEPMPFHISLENISPRVSDFVQRFYADFQNPWILYIQTPENYPLTLIFPGMDAIFEARAPPIATEEEPIIEIKGPHSQYLHTYPGSDWDNTTETGDDDDDEKCMHWLDSMNDRDLNGNKLQNGSEIHNGNKICREHRSCSDHGSESEVELMQEHHSRSEDDPDKRHNLERTTEQEDHNCPSSPPRWLPLLPDDCEETTEQADHDCPSSPPMWSALFPDCPEAENEDLSWAVQQGQGHEDSDDDLPLWATLLSN